MYQPICVSRLTKLKIQKEEEEVVLAFKDNSQGVQSQQLESELLQMYEQKIEELLIENINLQRDINLSSGPIRQTYCPLLALETTPILFERSREGAIAN